MPVPLLTGIIALVLGLILWLLARRSGARWSVSGAFIAGAGIVLLMFPAITQLTLDTSATSGSTVVSAAEASATPAPSPTPSLTPIAVEPVRVTRVALVLTPLPTRFVYSTPTVTETPAVTPTECSAIIRNNLNFRDAPDLNATLLATIPFSSRVDVYGRNADQSWLWVAYGTQKGWVSAQYVDLTGVCDALPEQAS